MTRLIPGVRPQSGQYFGQQDNHSSQVQYGDGRPHQDPSQGESQGHNQSQSPLYRESTHQAQPRYGTNQSPNAQYSSEHWNASAVGYLTGGSQYPARETYGECNYGTPGYKPDESQSRDSKCPEYAKGCNLEAQNNVSLPDPEVDAFKSHFDRPSSPANLRPSHTSQQASGTEEDRGVMGALAGSATGAYAGHKEGHHGVLGGIGGAVAGSMLESAIKSHKKEEQEEKHGLQHQPPPVPPHPHQPGGGVNHSAAGNFYASSRSVRLEGRCTLVAECADMGGHHRTARIDLNDCLTNTHGQIFWAKGGNFAASSRNIRLADGGNTLDAELGDGRGGWIPNRVRLNERITNNDGKLQFLHT